ncbi:MAG: type II toxin-antitoxin system Phd/YefM family antitoxin [Candidatus Competibacteraceae bacterium]
MKTISMLEFRKDAEQIIRQIQAGKRLLLTYRGKPVARLEPVLETTVEADDLFYSLYRLAEAEGQSLSNSEMDAILYAP